MKKTLFVFFIITALASSAFALTYDQAYKEWQDAKKKLETINKSDFAALEKKANTGDAKALMLVGYAYHGGIFVDRDHDKGEMYLWKAADAGSLLGKDMAARCAMNQEKVDKAFEFAKSASLKGQPLSMILLGNMYRAGVGTSKDPDMALQWYKKANELGHPSAVIEIGSIMYERGNMDEAAQWFRKGVAKGNSGAAEWLTTLIANSNVAEKEPGEQMRAYQICARGGRPVCISRSADNLSGLEAYKQRLLALMLFREEKNQEWAAHENDLLSKLAEKLGEEDLAKAETWANKRYKEIRSEN